MKNQKTEKIIINHRKKIIIFVGAVFVLIGSLVIFRYFNSIGDCSLYSSKQSCIGNFWEDTNLYIVIFTSSLLLSLLSLLFFSKKVFGIWVQFFPFIFVMSIIFAFAGANPYSPIGDDTPMLVIFMAVVQIFLTILSSIFSAIYFKIKSKKFHK